MAFEGRDIGPVYMGIIATAMSFPADPMHMAACISLHIGDHDASGIHRLEQRLADAPRRYGFPCGELGSRPLIRSIRMTTRACVRDPVRLTDRRRHESERMAADPKIGDLVHDARHVACDALTARALLQVMRVLLQRTARSGG